MKAMLAGWCIKDPENHTTDPSLANEHLQIFTGGTIIHKPLAAVGESIEARKDCRIMQYIRNRLPSWTNEAKLCMNIDSRPTNGSTRVILFGNHVLYQLLQIFDNGYMLQLIGKVKDTEERFITKELPVVEVTMADNPDHYDVFWQDVDVSVTSNFFTLVRSDPANVTFYVIISIPPVPSICDIEPNELSHMWGEILKQKVATDVILKTKDGEEVESHKVILAAQSPVFAAMMAIEMEESRTGEIQTELCKQSLTALLGYLYVRDILVPLREPQVALDLLEAGHKYDIGGMEDKMKLILLESPIEIFTVDEAIRLFLFVRNVDALVELKAKAIQVLVLNTNLLESSQEYRNLFRLESPGENVAAKELFTMVFSSYVLYIPWENYQACVPLDKI